MNQIIIRAIRPSDLEAIVEIDAKVLGKVRRDYWDTKLELMDSRSPMASLVADVDGRVVGFVLGDASGWEYRVPDTTGFIDTIGVDPAFQRRGVARLLVREMIDHLRKVGVHTVSTHVNWRDGDLLRFFDKMGFHRGDLINLDLKT